jgi:uncharacterized membrane protein YfcA
MNRYLKAVLGIVVLFAIGLVFYFMFSAAYGDGLERTMEESGTEEQGPFYTAPFDYGDDYLAALVAGLIGAGITFGIVYAYLRVVRRKRSEMEENETS